MKKHSIFVATSAFAALLVGSTSVFAAPFAPAPSVPAGMAIVQVEQDCAPGENSRRCMIKRGGGESRGGGERARPAPRREAPAQQARPRREAQPQRPAEAQRPRRQAPAEQPRVRREQPQRPVETQRPRRQGQPEQEIQRPRRAEQPRIRRDQDQRPVEVQRPPRAEQPRIRREQPPRPAETQRPRRQPLPEQEIQPPSRQGQPRTRRDQDQRPVQVRPRDTPDLRPGVEPGHQPRPRDRRQPVDVERLPESGQGPRDRVRVLPRDDRSAQERVRRARVRSIIEEQGERFEGEPRLRPRGRRPAGTEILREMGDRTILQYGDQITVESNDRRRIRRHANQIYGENLSGGRTRETIVRPDGSRVVTIRNDNGDIIRRSRFLPDDREVVLFYVEDEDIGYLDEWRDPGRDLPPLVLDIPREEYILDAEPNYTADQYYEFLDQPPVEEVERFYSVDEVKRSARIRQKTRRVDLDTITFEFGSSSIPEDQISKLEGVAGAMRRMLDKNPGETFLIEGHTDAVGSEYANLALSDRRAEAVAEALSNVFEIPAENLSSQGYGEEFLKVQTSEPERENRRVAIRRITPLVAPVASAN